MRSARQTVVRYGALSETAVLELLRDWRAGVRRKLVLRGLRAWDLRLPPMFRSPPHEHALPYFCVLVEGRFAYRDRGRMHEFRPHEVVFHPAGTVHSAFAGSRGARILTLESTPEWARATEEFARLPAAPTRVPTEEAAGAAHRLLRELRQPEPCSQLALEGLSLELVAALARREAVTETSSSGLAADAPSWIRRTLEEVHERFAEPMTLREVAATHDISPARFSLAFRRHAGCSFGEAVRRARVDFVRHALAAGDRSLAEIALAAGFADQAHCTRVFKAATGWTPGRYRSAVRRDNVARRAR